MYLDQGRCTQCQTITNKLYCTQYQTIITSYTMYLKENNQRPVHVLEMHSLHSNKASPGQTAKQGFLHS